MSEKSGDPQLSETSARYLAGKGTVELDDLQAIIDRARELLASGEVREPVGTVPVLHHVYEWENTQPPPDARPRVWRASIELFSTGQGLTAHYAAGRARDADEFRRKIAHEFGYAEAAAASLGEGVDSDVPFEKLFMSDALRAALEKVDRGVGAPAAMSFFSRYHSNYS